MKTSTGFASHGATPEAVQIMLTSGKGKIKVKTSGGIRTREQAEAYLKMGCERLGVGNIECLLTPSEKRRYGLITG